MLEGVARGNIPLDARVFDELSQLDASRIIDGTKEKQLSATIISEHLDYESRPCRSLEAENAGNFNFHHHTRSRENFLILFSFAAQDAKASRLERQLETEAEQHAAEIKSLQWQNSVLRERIRKLTSEQVLSL